MTGDNKFLGYFEQVESQLDAWALDTKKQYVDRQKQSLNHF